MALTLTPTLTSTPTLNQDAPSKLRLLHRTMLAAGYVRFDNPNPKPKPNPNPNPNPDPNPNPNPNP